MEPCPMGPVTYENNPRNGNFLTDLIEGDFVTIYLFEPLRQKGESTLTIKKVVHAYKNVIPTVNAGFGQSLGCNNDINCYPAWDFESDAVGMVLLANGTALCSGALLMTADQSFRPYFLSAFHCIDIDSANGVLSANERNNVEDWMFKFQYKKTVCNGNSASLGISYNGSTFRAGFNNSDMALLELDTSPVGNPEISYLGWDRTTNIPAAGTTIHHPQGDVMKISFDNNALQSNANIINWSNGTQSSVNSHWTATLDNGTSENGSSGSVILNQNRRIVGQLHGGMNGCAPVTKYYGRFDVSWIGGGTNDTRLSNWLDPCGSGAITTNTARPFSISGSDLICSSGTSFTVNNLPSGATINWTSSSSITLTSPQGSNPSTFSSVGSGNGWIQATITVPNGCSNNIVVRKEVMRGAPLISYDPNEDFTMCRDINTTSNNFFPVSIEGMDGSTTWEVQKITNNHSVTMQGNEVLVSLAYAPPYNYIAFKVRASNTCGFSNWLEYYVEVIDNCDSGGYNNYMVYPNPTSETINIKAKKSKEGSDNETSYQLYDFNAILIEKGDLNNQKKSIDVSNYKKGIYILKIEKGKEFETHSVIIK